MLKRYQVLLPEWLDEYIEDLVDKYDMSFSEVIRVQICGWILTTVSNLYPEYKPGIKLEDIFTMIKNDAQIRMEREDVHRMLSKIYFETRKAVEYRLAKEKKQKK